MPNPDSRPRRIALTPDDAVWYTDYPRGRLGRYDIETGEVRLKLYKGNIMNAGRRSPLSLYSEDVATMEGGAEEAYNQDDATGFIALNGLRLRASARQKQ